MGACDSWRMVRNSHWSSHSPTAPRNTICGKRCPIAGARRRVATADSDCSCSLFLSSLAAASHGPEQGGICSLVKLPDRLHISSDGHAGLLVCTQLCRSPRQAREWALEQSLHVTRAVIGQYTLDLQKRPQSLNDLVKAGYIKQTPTDPITRRNDTWDLEWSNDPKMPGIVNIRSGSITSSKGSAYHDW